MQQQQQYQQAQYPFGAGYGYGYSAPPPAQPYSTFSPSSPYAPQSLYPSPQAAYTPGLTLVSAPYPDSLPASPSPASPTAVDGERGGGCCQARHLLTACCALGLLAFVLLAAAMGLPTFFLLDVHGQSSNLGAWSVCDGSDCQSVSDDGSVDSTFRGFQVTLVLAFAFSFFALVACAVLRLRWRPGVGMAGPFAPGLLAFVAMVACIATWGANLAHLVDQLAGIYDWSVYPGSAFYLLCVATGATAVSGIIYIVAWVLTRRSSQPKSNQPVLQYAPASPYTPSDPSPAYLQGAALMYPQQQQQQMQQAQPMYAQGVVSFSAQPPLPPRPFLQANNSQPLSSAQGPPPIDPRPNREAVPNSETRPNSEVDPYA